MGLAKKQANAIAQISLPHVLPLVPPLGGNNQNITRVTNNGEASYVNNEACLGANTMVQFSYQPTRTMTVPSETMRKYFGIKLKPMKRPTHKKLYLEWMDRMMPLSKGYKTTNFSTFSSKDGKLIVEHIGRFTTKSGEASQNDFNKLYLFPLPLTGVAFT